MGGWGGLVAGVITVGGWLGELGREGGHSHHPVSLIGVDTHK